MGHTNSTTNYSLPQFITTDKPAWLTDINGAFSDIDTAVNNAQTTANTADGNATQAISDASAASTAAATADAKGAGALASIANAFDPTTIYAVGDMVVYNNLLYICSTAVITPGPWTGATNWDRITIEDCIDDVNSDIGTINTALGSKVDSTLDTFTAWGGTSVSLGYINNFSLGPVHVVSFLATVSAGNNGTIATIPLAKSAADTCFFSFGTNAGNAFYGYITGQTIKTDTVLPAGTYGINFIYHYSMLITEVYNLTTNSRSAAHTALRLFVAN